MPTELPRLISVDDHVVEPPNVWSDHLPTTQKDAGPNVVRRRGVLTRSQRAWTFVEDASADWADCWSFEGALFPCLRSFAAVSYAEESQAHGAGTFDEFRPGTYDRAARLIDMDANHTEASLSFPTFPRFCGQTFLEARDHGLAAACVRAYNDWMIEDWCAGDVHGRLIPLTLVPLWDAELAASEVRRCAAKGSHAICFSESPPALGLPSIFTEFWEPLWQACDDTKTVVNMHIGSSSTFFTTSDDAPTMVALGLGHESCEHALVDWLSSGIFDRYPTLKIALSEGQAGWIPYVLERLDHAHTQERAHLRWNGTDMTKVPIARFPSEYMAGHVYACIFDDETSLANRDRIGMSQIMFEVDYPHVDSTWPSSADVAARMVSSAGLDDAEARQLLRGNAIDCYGLARYGLST